MDYMECARFVKAKHKGQMRDQGIPYFYHPLAVSEILKEKGFNLEYQVTGLFHDLLEDTNTTEEEILELSNERVLEAVKLLTKKEGMSIEEYLNGIKGNHMALMVKLADRYHNLQTLKFRPSKKIQTKLDETMIYFEPLAKNTQFEEALLEAATISQQISNDIQHITTYKLEKK